MAENSGGARQGQIGMIGLGVMGSNLALNIDDHGFAVAVWNRTTEKTERFVDGNPGRRLIGTKTLEQFMASLERPRRIILMIKAGSAVDEMLDAVKPLLSRGDIVIDAGNSWFMDTQRRDAALKDDGINYFGMGVSGGEEGARFGPSIMPGGPADAYKHLAPILEAIAAKTDSGPCVSYVGPDGSGHFVKMVHNGIEYGQMQLIAEVYDVLRKGLGLGAADLAEIFADWNEGMLGSFLTELTSKVFTVQDGETGRPLVDVILDKAEQKGTGKWTVQVALDLGVPIPTIAAGVEARVLSSMKEQRVAAAGKIRGPAKAAAPERRELVDALHDALLASEICSYAQGMCLIKSGSDQYKWNVNLREVARIWKGGCIIRARLLNPIMEAYGRNPNLPNLLVDAEFTSQVASAQANWRKAVSGAVALGIPAPALSASLAYFDAYRTADLPQNLTQAQRDAFGAHTYVRADHPERGSLHTDWAKQAEQHSAAGAGGART